MSTTAPVQSFWSRSVPWWHGVLGGVLVLVGAAVVLDPATVGARLAALGALGAAGLAYLLAGRHALGAGRLWLALAYLVTAWAAYVVVVQVTPAGYALLFVLFPQSWAMLPDRRSAVTWNVLAVGVFAATQVSLGQDVGGAVVSAGFQLVLSLLLGLWTTGLIEESVARAELIAELERTRAELAETERARGVLTERARLSREIHDTLAQGFTSILTLAQAIERALDDDIGTARARLRLLERTARENLAEARALVAELGPVDLESSTLVEAVQRLADRFGAETAIPVELSVEGDVASRRSAASEVVLLRAAQEALANVRRHSGAGAVRLRLALADGAELVVVDDGRGFELPDGAHRGFGLEGMRSRARQVGGELLVASAPGQGTTVRVRVP